MYLTKRRNSKESYGWRQHKKDEDDRIRTLTLHFSES